MNAGQKPFEFRDQTTPARICHLLQVGAITSTDLLLLWIINSMVKRYGEPGEDLGCFSSNAYLGISTGCNPDYISTRISKLNEMGLVVIVRWNGRRNLELEWSRIAEEREELRKQGGYGEALWKAYKKTTENLEVYKSTALGKPQAPLEENLKHKNTDKNKKSLSPGTRRPAGDSPPVVQSARLSPILDEKLTAAQQAQRRLCGRLWEAVCRHGKLEPRSKLSRWYVHFAELSKTPGISLSRVEEVLDWYCDHFGERYVPVAYSAKAFVAKFRAVESAMERSTREADVELARKDGKVHYKTEVEVC